MARLIAKEEFGAFGTRYAAGAEIPNGDIANWPEGTLATRLENGSVVYDTESYDGGGLKTAVENADSTAAQIKVRVPFSAWGKQYEVGDIVDQDDADAWPAGTLATRANNGDVEFVAGETVDNLNSAKVTTDSNGALDGGAPKTAVGDNVKDSQPARAKESALHPMAGAPAHAGGVEVPEDERGGAETGTLDKLAAKSPQTLGESLKESSDAANEARKEENGDDEEEGDEPLPKIAELDDHLAGIDDVAEVKALQKRDTRVTAEPKYEARIKELEEGGSE